MGQSDSHGNSERLYTHVQFTPTQRNNPGEIISIRLVSVLVFLAGTSQLLFWTVAQLTKSVVFLIGITRLLIIAIMDNNYI